MPRQLSDDLLEILRKFGNEHEEKYLSMLRAELKESGREVINLDLRSEGRPETREVLKERMTKTASAMAGSANALYQPTLYTESGGFGWLGIADFLVANEHLPSDLGSYLFEPRDTKLARVAKVNAIVQLCEYAEQLRGIQGVSPEYVRVVTGSDDVGTVSVRLSEVSAFFRRLKNSLTEFLNDLPENSEPEPKEHCGICRWKVECHEHWRKSDDLTFVADLSTSNRDELRAKGIKTLEQLAKDDLSGVGITPGVLQRLKKQAELQLATRESQKLNPDEPPKFQLLRPIEPEKGFNLLPQSNDGDIFYDIEGHPYRGKDGLEYLHGLLTTSRSGKPEYKDVWAHSPEEEREAFIEVVDFITTRILQNGFDGLRVYHYGNYEPSALQRLAARHAVREREVEELIHQGRFVDLSRVVKQGLRIGVESYSIKKLEILYGFERHDLVEEGKLSIVCYEEWLASRTSESHGPDGDIQVLSKLRNYNENDCLSTLKLRSWLEERRSDLEESLSAEDRPSLTRPLLTLSPPDDKKRELPAIVRELNEGRFDSPPSQNPERKVKWLLADLLGYYQREGAVERFEKSQLLRMVEEELIASPQAIGGLQLISRGIQTKKTKISEVRKYRFPPQTTKVEVGDNVTAPNLFADFEGAEKSTKPTLVVVSLNLDDHEIEINLTSTQSEISDPTGIFVDETFSPSSFEDALLELATDVQANEKGGKYRYPAAVELLKRQASRLRQDSDEIGVVDKYRDWESISSIVHSLDASYLAIQGPPGTGKTYTAANVILDLVKLGKRVGVTANNYGALSRVRAELIKHAAAHGFSPDSPLKVVERSEVNTEPEAGSLVKVTGRSNAQAAASLAKDAQVVMGVRYFFARKELRNSLDFLIADEAGQLSLADSLAVSLAATNLVLVGDPQQLPHISKATHPSEAGLSGLSFINQGRDVVPEGFGVLLGITKRMHPKITEFVSEQVYESKLRAADGCENQAISGDDWLSGAGLRWNPINHQGRSMHSPEEVEAVVDSFYSILGREFTDAYGNKSPIGPRDIFVVTPYNIQRTALLKALTSHPDAETFDVTLEVMRSRVGTVDKAQGDEAAVVLVSYTSSSREDIPHGMDFLYSKNRFNVAVSRARALVVVFASPDLLNVKCRTIAQVKLVNMLCRFVEVAATK
jgi:uncharacterized protein